MKRIIVTGSRTYTNRGAVERALLEIGEGEPLQIIHGGATGADALADEIAREKGWPKPLSYPISKADWNRLGKKAGPLRNQQMLDEGNAEAVIAFPLPGSKGTWDMVQRARKAGLRVHIRACS